MGTIVRQNERSWAIEIITEINLILKGLNIHIKRAGGESTLSVNKKSMFPDVLIYADEAQTKILQGWELKMPDVLITDEQFIYDATRKAKALGLNSFFIWNFTYGKLYIKDDKDVFKEAKAWTGTDHIRTRADVKNFKDKWIPIIKDVIIEINNYLENGRITTSPIIDVLTDNLMTAIIERNKDLVAENYQIETTMNMEMERRMKVWWASFHDEYAKDETNMFSAYAKSVLLNWTNRIIFANVIKKYHTCANLIKDINISTSPEEGNNIINEIVVNGDFYNVFQKLEYNDRIPRDTWIDIVDFNQFLYNNKIENIDQSVLQDIMEKTINVSKREIRGQYATPMWLADLLTQITVNDWSGNCADLCAGTGTIAKAIIKNKMKRLKSAERTLQSTWVSDKYAYPLQIANISLTTIEAINIPINIFQMNVFDQEIGRKIIIKNPVDGLDIEKTFPEVDTIISNLPFVKYNNIAADESEYIVKYTSSIFKNTGVKFKSGKTDLYMFLPFKLHELLNQNGKLGIILSNSWLGTNIGKDFFVALTYYYSIESVILSNCGKWFENADVVSTLLILRKKDISDPDIEEHIDFCLIQKEVKNLDNEQYESLISSIILHEELDNSIVQIKSYKLKDIAKIQNKGISINALFHNIEWVNKIENLLIPITDYFYVKRGERRGWNDLFYPSKDHGIEEEYIKPVLKNAANLKGYIAKTDIVAFCCHKSKAELKQLGHTGAINWIEKFEHINNTVGIPLPISLSHSGRHWYEMDNSTRADFLTILNPNKRLFVAKFDKRTFVDQRFTRLLIKKNNISVELLFALLNSLYGMFAIESIGFGRGLGVLDASSSNFKKVYMINPELISANDAKEIIRLFKPIRSRNVMDLEDELNDKNREMFDRKVLQAIGEEDSYDNIKNSLLSMQHTRLTVKNR